MARMCAAAAGGNTKDVDNMQCRKQQRNETRVDIAQELDKLIKKIGIVNLCALLHALNGAEIVDVDSPCTKDFKAGGWFALDACRYVAVRVDEDLMRQERLCQIDKIRFGLK